MSRSFLLLHGFGNRRPPEHWMHWLAAQLTEAGDHVIYPQLPDPDSPSLAAWRGALDGHLEALAGSAGSAGSAGERIVLCHSLSCLLWLHATISTAGSTGSLDPAVIPDRLVLVSPPGAAWIPEPARAEFSLPHLDGDALRASAGEVRILCSDNDPYNPPGVVVTYGGPLGVPCEVISGGGHLSADDGYGPWPAMRAWCADPVGPVVTATQATPAARAAGDDPAGRPGG